MSSITKTTAKWLRKTKYIPFKCATECSSQKVHKKDFLGTLETLSASYKQINHTTKRSLFKPGNFALTMTDNYLRLTWCDIKTHKYYQRYTNYKDDKKNDPTTGTDSEIKQLINNMGGKTEFNKLFGTVNQGFKRCVPGLFQWTNQNYIDGKCITTGKLDYSSHFPACSCGTLPDANTMITKRGIIEPTEEYPFAFYIRSGFVAEYNKYNTHDWLNTEYKDCFFFSEKRRWPVFPDKYNNDDELTVLMKASKGNLNKEMADFYLKKLLAPKNSKERDNAKLVLLKVIGQFEMNSRTNYSRRPYAHLAAVIKARAIYKILCLINTKLGGDKNVIQVIVDGIIFNNYKKKHYGDKEEFIGSLKEEHFCDYGKFKGHNQYVIIDEDGVADICHSGFDIGIDSIDFKDWKRSPSMRLIDHITKKLHLQIEELNRYGKEE